MKSSNMTAKPAAPGVHNADSDAMWWSIPPCAPNSGYDAVRNSMTRSCTWCRAFLTREQIALHRLSRDTRRGLLRSGITVNATLPMTLERESLLHAQATRLGRARDVLSAHRTEPGKPRLTPSGSGNERAIVGAS